MKKLKSLLGFSMKAGKLVSGTEQVLSAVRNGKAELVIIASDASEGSKKRIKDKSLYYKVNCIEMFDVETLSSIIGKSKRTCVVIIDKHFKDCILKEITEH